MDENALTHVIEGEEHLNFSSLDTLDNVDPNEHIAIRSESSGNSSSSTTNDRSVLCRSNGLGTLNAPNRVTNQNFGTLNSRRPTAQPPPIPNNPPPPPKKQLAPKPPNIVVISNAGSTTKVDNSGTLQRNGLKSNQTPSHYHSHNTFTTPAIAGKSPCINNIYIETFSNHHKSSPNVSGKVSQAPSLQSGSNGHTHHYGHGNVNANVQPVANGQHAHAHYHHYHHHHPNAAATTGHHYFGANGSIAPNHHYHHAHESQLMNLETTEL